MGILGIEELKRLTVSKESDPFKLPTLTKQRDAASSESSNKYLDRAKDNCSTNIMKVYHKEQNTYLCSKVTST